MRKNHLDGCLNMPTTLKNCLYSKLANMTGIPAITIPNGIGENDMPTGIMFHTKWVMFSQ